jgi:hypothetical protein
LGKSDLVLPIYSTPALCLFYQAELRVSFIDIKPPEQLEHILINFVKAHATAVSTSPSKGRPSSERLLLRLSFATDFLQHKNFSRVKIIDFATGNFICETNVDRATTTVLLFLTYARRKSPGLTLLDKGGVTGRGAEVLRGMRRLYRLGPTPLVGIEKRDSDDQQGTYVAKNISRINKIFRNLIGRTIIGSSGNGYVLAEDIEVEVLQGEQRHSISGALGS